MGIGFHREPSTSLISRRLRPPACRVTPYYLPIETQKKTHNLKSQHILLFLETLCSLSQFGRSLLMPQRKELEELRALQMTCTFCHLGKTGSRRVTRSHRGRGAEPPSKRRLIPATANPADLDALPGRGQAASGEFNEICLMSRSRRTRRMPRHSIAVRPKPTTTHGDAVA